MSQKLSLMSFHIKWVLNVAKTEFSYVTKTNYLNIIKSDVFKATKTNFFNIAKGKHINVVETAFSCQRNGKKIEIFNVAKVECWQAVTNSEFCNTWDIIATIKNYIRTTFDTTKLGLTQQNPHRTIK